jgi:hypothetical protein
MPCCTQTWRRSVQFGAQRQDRRIIVEIKSFLGPSLTTIGSRPLGQYEVYRRLLQITDPDRELFLAIGSPVYENFFHRKSVQLVTRLVQVKPLVVRLDTEEVERWISEPVTGN